MFSFPLQMTKMFETWRQNVQNWLPKRSIN